MSNALRLFIRESLTNEVDQRTWIRPGGPKPSSTTSFTAPIPGALGKAASTGLGKIKGAAKRAWQSNPSKSRVFKSTVGLGLLASVVGGLAGLFAGSSKDSDGEAGAAAFEDKITEIISKSSAAIIEELRTPEIKSGLDPSAAAEAQTAVITAYETNYAKHADSITAAATAGGYANFFTKIPAFKSCQAGLDNAINDQIAGSADSNAKSSLESFVLNYLIYHAICFTNTDPASANGMDAAELDRAGFVTNNNSNQVTYDNLQTIINCNKSQANKINGNTACVAVIDQFAE